MERQWMRQFVAVRQVAWITAWGAACLPAAWMIYLVIRYSVDLPLSDAWDLTGGILRSSLRVTSLLGQHNESRPFFPRLISYALARLTHWDTRWEMALTLLQATANLGLMLRLYILGERKVQEAGTAAPPWRVRPGLVFLAGIFIFNMFQTDYLWGLQYLCHIPTTCLLTALVVYESRGAMWMKQSVAVLLCVFAMYSFSNGMALWPLVGGYVMLRGGFKGGGRGWLAVWIAVAAACFWLYFRDYVHPPGLPKFTAAFHKPGQLILNFLTFFGAPLGYLDRNNLSRAISSLAGLFILTTAAGGFAAALWHRRNRAMFEASLPWMVISAYLILSGTMAALGRTGFGDFAMLETTRYGEFSNYLPAALVFWEAGVHRFLEQQGGAWRVVLPRVRYVQLGMLAVVLPLAAAFSYPRMVEWHRIRLQYRAAMMFVEDVPSPRLWIVYPRVEKLAHYMRLMRSLDLIRPLPGLGMFEDARQRPAGGEIREVRWRGDKLDVYGWAVLPGKKRTADIVVLTAEAGGKSKAIAVAYPELAAPAWARQATLRESSGWAVNGMEVPAGSRVHAWAVDGETGAIYPLSGEVAASQPGGGGG